MKIKVGEASMMVRRIHTIAVLVCFAGLLAAPAAFGDEAGTDPAAPTPAPETAPPPAAADAPPAATSGHGSLAANATDPTAALISARIQNYFIFQSMDKGPIDADGYANQLDVQAVIPFPKLGWYPRSILRPTIPMVTTPDLKLELDLGVLGSFDFKQKSKTGLGDIDWVYLLIPGAFEGKWGTIGVGPAGAFPTATDKLLGAQKWTFGPAIVGIFKMVPKLQWGALVFNTWSVGGHGDNDVNSLTLQPILTWHFAPTWYTGWGDTALSFDWEDSRKLYAPLSYRLGKIVSIGSQKIDVNGEFIYNVGDRIPGRDRWGFKLTFNFLFPEK